MLKIITALIILALIWYVVSEALGTLEGWQREFAGRKAMEEASYLLEHGSY